MLPFVASAAPTLAQRIGASVGKQNPYWVLEAADGTDQAISFWDAGQANAVATGFSWFFSSATVAAYAPTWHYAALALPNPTIYNGYTIDSGRGLLYVTQKGATAPMGSAAYESNVYVNDVPPGATSGTAQFLGRLEGQPQMLLLPSLNSGSPNGIASGTFCPAYYALYYQAANEFSTLGGLYAHYIRPVATGSPLTVNAGSSPTYAMSTACNTQIIQSNLISCTYGAIAVTKAFTPPLLTKRQVVYMALGQEPHITTSTTEEGIYAVTLIDRLQGAVLPLASLTDPGLCGNLGRPLTKAESKLIGASVEPLGTGAVIKRYALAGATKETFTTSELEVTADRKRLAWGGKDGKLYVAALDPFYGGINLNVSPAVVAVANFSVAPNQATNSRINGLEFAPDGSYDLYVTVGTDNAGSVDGFYKIPSTSTTSIQYGAPTRYANPAVGTNTQWVAQSQIEADRNGLLRLLGVPAALPASYAYLLGFDPAANGGAGAFVATDAPKVTAALAKNVKGVVQDVRRLPRQVDGYDYAFSGHIYGPSYVKTRDLTYTCPNPPVVPGPINPMATYAVDALDAGWAPTYLWTVTPLNGSDAVTGFMASTTNTQTVTFPTANNGSYQLKCQIAPGNGCSSLTRADAVFTVNTGDGCLPLPQRPAAPDPSLSDPAGVQVFPVPADDRLELTRDDAAAPGAVELADWQGRVRWSQTWASRALTVPTSDLPAGLYVLRVREANGRVVARRVSIQHD